MLLLELWEESTRRCKHRPPVASHWDKVGILWVRGGAAQQVAVCGCSCLFDQCVN